MVVEEPMWKGAASGMLAGMSRPGALSLIGAADRDDGLELLVSLANAMGDVPISVSQTVLGDQSCLTEREVVTRLAEHRMLYDLEVLCWQPWLNVDPLRLLKQLARRHGVVAVWPGSIQGRSIEFSVPGRRDHVRADAVGVNVLRPVRSQFPDEVPFILESSDRP
jgi:hypothetical protein